ncbi:hypothetical protein A2U01_0085288, partial [Trifolium medium]|nr:hypothetical protein [Trifolium medium]
MDVIHYCGKLWENLTAGNPDPEDGEN